MSKFDFTEWRLMLWGKAQFYKNAALVEMTGPHGEIIATGPELVAAIERASCPAELIYLNCLLSNVRVAYHRNGSPPAQAGLN